jgi:hypothetical protein
MASPLTHCEWSGCEELAAVRVSFGYRLGEPEPRPTMHELSLCGSHLEQVKLNFLVVDTEPIA